MLRRRPFFPRDSVALSAGWVRGFAPQKSDDTEVGPPVLLRARRESVTFPILTPHRWLFFKEAKACAREQNDDSGLPRCDGLG